MDILSLRMLPLVCLFAVASNSCGLMPPESTSSGLLMDHNRPRLPSGIPEMVAVLPFNGDSSIAIHAADQFSSGLVRLGFNALERQDFDRIIRELELQHSGMISDATLQAVGKQLGAEGIFVGSVSGKSTSYTVNTFLNLKLVDIKTGKVTWAGSFSDPRIFGVAGDHSTSIAHTTQEALRVLQKDLNQHFLH